MLNRFLYRLVPIFLSATFTIVSCGPSPEEKARIQALRDSASIDSALKKEAFFTAARTRTRLQAAAHLRDSVAELRKATRDSLYHTDSAQRRRHRDSLVTGLNVKKPLSHQDSVRRRHVRDSIRTRLSDTTLHPRKRKLKIDSSINDTSKH